MRSDQSLLNSLLGLAKGGGVEVGEGWVGSKLVDITTNDLKHRTLKQLNMSGIKTKTNNINGCSGCQM